MEPTPEQPSDELTEQGEPVGVCPDFDPDHPYRLNPSVALREEPFGALAYHFGNRRLSFLKAPELVEVVRSLGGYDTVHAALQQVPERRRAGFLTALTSLAHADMIVPNEQ